MKKSPWSYLVPVVVVFAVLAVVLFFINPLGPLLLLASLVVQLPIIYIISRTAFSSGYADRSYNRRQQFLEDGNAAHWLEAEQKEERSVGFSFWSAASKTDNNLNQAEAMIALGLWRDAAGKLAAVDEKKLGKTRRQRYDELAESLAAADKDSPPHHENTSDPTPAAGENFTAEA